MSKKRFLYRHPADFPIPEGTDQIDCLKVTIPQAIGILEILRDTNNCNPQDATGAIEAVISLLRQSDMLVDSLLADLIEESKEVTA